MEPETLIYADRSERAKLRFAGPQRLWFLHQILTQSFEDAEPGDARTAALLTPHGRMVGYLEALVTDEAVLCHFEPELAGTLPEAIRRYVLATDVDITDVTADLGLVLLAGPGHAAQAGELAPDVLVHPTDALGCPAVYLWCLRRELARVIERLNGVAQAASEVELEAIRIANGAPRWGRDMDEKTFPQEAGVDKTAVHYHKGCYVGQEAMAKIHFRGKVNRRLARLASSAPLAAGADVTLNGERVGRVTSSANGCALAMLRHNIAPGERVSVADVAAEVVA